MAEFCHWGRETSHETQLNYENDASSGERARINFTFEDA